MIGFMRRFGGVYGMNQPTEQGAKRYIDVLHGVGGPYESGRTSTSKPKKMTGPMVACEQPHLLDTARQDTAMALLDRLAQVQAR